MILDFLLVGPIYHGPLAENAMSFVKMIIAADRANRRIKPNIEYSYKLVAWWY